MNTQVFLCIFLKLRKIFGVRKSSILANLFQINLNAYGLCACTYENTFRNIKSGDEVCGYSSVKKQLSLAQLENWENIKPARGPA